MWAQKCSIMKEHKGTRRPCGIGVGLQMKVTTSCRNLRASLGEGAMPSAHIAFPPNMGTFFLPSPRAWLLMESSGADVCSLTPSEWIGAEELQDVREGGCLFLWTKNQALAECYLILKPTHHASFPGVSFSIYFLLIWYGCPKSL